MSSTNQPPDWWQEAVETLSERDAILARLIERYPNSYLKKRGEDPFSVLVNAIIGQQISVKAAESIRAKLVDKTEIKVVSIIESKSALSEVGLSKQKAAYIYNIAEWFHENSIDPQWFYVTENEQIKTELIGIKGVGQWTWEMFDICYLQSPNVLPLSDVGVLKGIEMNYGVTRQQILTDPMEWQERWSPYRTLACWFLWRSLDPVEVNY